jgi:ABC-2 type transport system permease protein
MLIMYLCAIFYSPERLLKSGFFWLLQYNPLYCIIAIFRASVFGELMDMSYFLYALGFSVATIVVGLLLFIKKQDEFILNI